MKPLAEILRQLGLDTTSHPLETAALHEDHASVETAPIRIPPGLMDLIKARVQANHAFAHVEWPQRGQILRLEKIKPTFDERPFLVLLTDRTTTPNVWTGYVVAPESELDYSANGDIPLDELVAMRDPMAAFVQLWNPVRIPVPSATACLAWLDLEAMDKVLAAVEELNPSPVPSLPLPDQSYRSLYRTAAEQWNSVAAQLDISFAPGVGLFERLTAQIAKLVKLAPVGQWRPAVEYPMGPEEGQGLIWNLPDLEIRFDSHVCKIRKIGADDRSARADLFLDNMLLESRRLDETGVAVVFQLSPQHNVGKLKLTIRQSDGSVIELML